MKKTKPKPHTKTRRRPRWFDFLGIFSEDNRDKAPKPKLRGNGYTKHTMKPANKKRRKMAKASRRINRKRR